MKRHFSGKSHTSKCNLRNFSSQSKNYSELGKEMLHCLRGDGCPCFREAVHIENKPLKALHLHKRQFYLSIKCIYFFIKLNEMKLPHSMPSVRKIRFPYLDSIHASIRRRELSLGTVLTLHGGGAAKRGIPDRWQT